MREKLKVRRTENKEGHSTWQVETVQTKSQEVGVHVSAKVTELSRKLTKSTKVTEVSRKLTKTVKVDGTQTTTWILEVVEMKPAVKG